MNKVVVFTRNNARVIYVEDITPYIGNRNSVINPDMSKVIGIAPHFWKYSVNGPVEMNDLEKEAVIADQSKNGVDNSSSLSAIQSKKGWIQLYKHRLFYVACGLPLGMLLGVIVGLMKGKW